PDVDLAAARVRLEQAKGLKDRVVPLSAATVDALRDYLAVRGPVPVGTDHLFLYSHRPLSHTYCYDRLRTYGGRCGVQVTPHQLRQCAASRA
ncbi:MAG: site-specific integrase, partial [Chloroflexi bacterium]|nr:site-specific integrase [Chloroflexota bacterium]